MYTYSSDWINKHENLKHWIYYWHQIDLVRKVAAEKETILEIGVGTKFTSNYLKSKNYDVTTLDIDSGKMPDIVANVVDYDFNRTFDYILAFEVFEHMPFTDFEKVLGKLHGVCKKNLLLSIPRNEKLWLSLSIELPGNRKYNFEIKTRRNKLISKHHQWELDYQQWTKRHIENTFLDNHYTIDSCRKVSSLFFYSLKKSD